MSQFPVWRRYSAIALRTTPTTLVRMVADGTRRIMKNSSQHLPLGAAASCASTGVKLCSGECPVRAGCRRSGAQNHPKDVAARGMRGNGTRTQAPPRFTNDLPATRYGRGREQGDRVQAGTPPAARSPMAVATSRTRSDDPPPLSAMRPQQIVERIQGSRDVIAMGDRALLGSAGLYAIALFSITPPLSGRGKVIRERGKGHGPLGLVGSRCASASAATSFGWFCAQSGDTCPHWAFRHYIASPPRRSARSAAPRAAILWGSVSRIRRVPSATMRHRVVGVVRRAIAE